MCEHHHRDSTHVRMNAGMFHILKDEFVKIIDMLLVLLGLA